MKPGDFITINLAEAKLLSSEAFQASLTPAVEGKIELSPVTGDAAHQQLALPKVGRRVAVALRIFAAADGTDRRDADIASHLADAIEPRVLRG